MNVRCDECSSVFRVDPAKVPASGVRARCSVCGGVMRVGGAGTPLGMAAVAAASPAIASTAMSAMPAAPTAALPPRPPTADAPAPARAPSAPPPAAPVSMPPAPSAAAGDAAAPTPIWTSPTDVPTMRHTPAAERSAVSDAPGRTPVPGQPAQVGPRITPRVGSAVPPSPGAPARRPINPYLSADPQQKARRLARALVSDIVAYHPQKREEALRTGALKQLFRDEIKKSYEEYVEQVGKELADTTTHFQDALNDVLAGGRRIF